MPSQGKFLIATAIIEVGTGLSLVSVPGLTIGLLFGVRQASPEALIVGRVGGVALLALGVACWLARDDRGGRSQHGLLCGMLIYNAGAGTVLAFAGSIWGMAGVALWPGVVLHAAMLIWCAVNLRTLAVNER